MEVCIYKDEALTQEGQSTVSDAERLEIESAIAHHLKMVELADNAGLKQQAASHSQLAKAAETKLLPPPPFPEVTPAQFAVWKRFLPTAYSGPAGLARYNYDLAPPQVLEVIGEYKDSFTALEIRTAEKMKDPALFGSRNLADKSVTYLLARWGESQLLSFEDIKREVVKGVSKEDLYVGLISAIGFTAASIAILVLFPLVLKALAIFTLLGAGAMHFLAKEALAKYRKTMAEIAAA